MDDSDLYVILEVINNPNTNGYILDYLAKNKMDQFGKEIAQNPKTETETLIFLSKSSDFFTIRALAKNPNTPTDILFKIAETKDWALCVCVAKNPSTPEDVLLFLTEHENESVRYYMAHNPNITRSVAEALIKKNEIDVLRNLSENPNVPIDILEKLMYCEPPLFTFYLKANIPENILISKFTESKKPEERFCILLNSNLSPKTFAILTKSFTVNECKKVLESREIYGYKLLPALMKKINTSKKMEWTASNGDELYVAKLNK